MIYFFQVLTFLAALIALVGGTWDSKRKGFRKITVTGIIGLSIAFLSLITSIIITNNSEKQASIQAKQLEDALNNTESIKVKIIETEAQLRIYKEIVDEIRHRSDRYLQTVMAEYVQLYPGRTWSAPNRIYPGSILRLYGFNGKILLSYADIRQIINTDYDRIGASEVAIIGNSGRGMRWSLTNLSGEFTHGKVYVESTPRIRSNERSWEEESGHEN